MTVTTETWLDVMPAIPLANAVPLIHIGPDEDGLRAVALQAPGNRMVIYGSDTHYWDAATAFARGFRVDLGDPQGFAFSARALFTDPGGCVRLANALPEGWGQWDALSAKEWLANRVLGHELTTDADRLALGRAWRNPGDTMTTASRSAGGDP